jgi:hypothetical protein
MNALERVMTPEEFVEIIRITVHDAAIHGTQECLENPPGRRPSAQERVLSSWFKGLPSQDRAHVASVIQHSVHSALFGVFCVLDGVRAIEHDAKGTLQLLYVNGENRQQLNSEEDELHDIYQSLVYKEVFGES